MLVFVRTVNTDGFKPNLETHLIPLLATEPEKASSELNDKMNASSSKDPHHQLLMEVPLRFICGYKIFEKLQWGCCEGGIFLMHFIVTLGVEKD